MYKIRQIFRNTDYLPLCHSKDALKAADRISVCRTSSMPRFAAVCEDCGDVTQRYCSCGNRNCPTCQGMKQAVWVEKRMDEALDVPYFHTVFTVPDDLNPLFMREPKMYDLLFRSVSETLLTLGKDERYLGGTVGFIAVLHTWGSNLSLHPHLHVILPGCALKGNKVLFPKQEDFLFPVRVMSRLFRGKFLHYMKELGLSVPAGLYEKEWVVYMKDVPDKGSHVIRYLGRYTHRTAISDARIRNFTEDTVTFSYKDYRDSALKEMTLSSSEFVRRFLLHVLPKGFRKIRFYGFLCNRKRTASICRIRNILRMPTPHSRIAGKSHREMVSILLGKSCTCPNCGSDRISFYFIC